MGVAHTLSFKLNLIITGVISEAIKFSPCFQGGRPELKLNGSVVWQIWNTQRQGWTLTAYHEVTVTKNPIYPVIRRRKSHDPGKGKAVEPSLHGWSPERPRVSQERTTWGQFELSLFNIYSFYFRPERGFTHSKVWVVFFLVSDGNRSNKMSLLCINLMLWLLHNRSWSKRCLLGTQMSAIPDMAYLGSNKLLFNLGPYFFDTGMIKFIAVLVPIRKSPSHRHPDLMWDSWFIMRHNVKTCFHFLPVSTPNSHVFWLKSSPSAIIIIINTYSSQPSL